MKRRATAGYTIVEVIIVLAVTGGLLVSAMLVLGGKQSQTQSSESAHLFESNIEATSREVASGFYSSDYSCTAVSAGPVSLGAGGEAGGNTGCIFLGKVINMEPTTSTTINIVGRQFIDGSTTDDVSTIAEAQPVKVTSGTTQFTYPYSLRVTKILDSAGASNYQGLAYFIELGGGISIANNPVNGSRGIQLYGIRGNPGDSPGSNVDLSLLVPLPEGAKICMKTANDKPAEITVGIGGNQYTTNTLIDNGVDNDCR